MEMVDSGFDLVYEETYIVGFLSMLEDIIARDIVGG